MPGQGGLDGNIQCIAGWARNPAGSAPGVNSLAGKTGREGARPDADAGWKMLQTIQKFARTNFFTRVSPSMVQLAVDGPKLCE